MHVAIACGADAEPQLRRALDAAVVTAWLTATSVELMSPPPDVLVVDVESLGAAALDLIDHVMRGGQPMPILALCPPEDRHPSAIEVLLHGAVHAIPRRSALQTGSTALRQGIELVSGVQVVRRTGPAPGPSAPANQPATVVGMAASTGGPAAVAEVLSRLAAVPVPILLVQHLHKDFMDGFVRWLGGRSARPVSLAVHGAPARPGQVHVAPAGQHLCLRPDRTLGLDTAPATTERPSANVLFRSLAEVAGPASLGVLLTGMGTDGAEGLLAMRRAGARTLVQDEATSAVYGMPKAARELGAAQRVLPLGAIAGAILAAVGAAVR